MIILSPKLTSVPKLRRDPLETWYTRYPAFVIGGVARELLPARTARAIRAGRYDALMCHFALTGLIR